MIRQMEAALSIVLVTFEGQKCDRNLVEIGESFCLFTYEFSASICPWKSRIVV